MKQQIYAASFIFLMKENKFLAMRRANTGYMDGSLSLPSGHIEVGEMPSIAAARELAEETNISVTLETLHYQHVQHYMDTERKVTYINHYFKCDNWSGEPKNNEPDKCTELVWLDAHKTHEELIEQVQLAQLSLHHQNIYSEYSPNQKKAF